MAELRRLGIYVLPDDTGLVAVADGRGGYLLYTLADWKLFPPRAGGLRGLCLGRIAPSRQTNRLARRGFN